jgi:hypothetical protein
MQSAACKSGDHSRCYSKRCECEHCGHAPVAVTFTKRVKPRKEIGLGTLLTRHPIYPFNPDREKGFAIKHLHVDPREKMRGHLRAVHHDIAPQEYCEMCEKLQRQIDQLGCRAE